MLRRLVEMLRRSVEWGNLIQLLGVILLGAGIICEIAYQGNIYFIIITLGATIFAVGTKIKGA